MVSAIRIVENNYIPAWNLQNNPFCYILFTNDKLAQHPFYSYISLFEVIGFKFSINRLIKLIFRVPDIFLVLLLLSFSHCSIVIIITVIVIHIYKYVVVFSCQREIFYRSDKTYRFLMYTGYMLCNNEKDWKKKSN